MSDSIIGRGTTLHYGDIGATAAENEITNISDISFPELTVADVKDINYTSPDFINDYLAGWIEGGTVNFTKDFVAADHSSLQGLLRQRKVFVIGVAAEGENPAGDFQFEGYLNKLGGGAPNEDKATISGSIKVCSLPTFTPAA